MMTFMFDLYIVLFLIKFIHLFIIFVDTGESRDPSLSTTVVEHFTLPSADELYEDDEFVLFLFY